MFDTLTGRLDGIFKKLRSRGKLHPKQVDAALADLRVALLEADVAAEVADDLLARVRERALSEEVMKSLTPAQPDEFALQPQRVGRPLGPHRHRFTHPRSIH